MPQNKNKTVIVIGGSGLIGKSIVASLKTTHRVINADISGNSTDGLFFKTDITSESSLKALIDFATQNAGEIDAVVNCAYPRGANYGAPIEKVSYRDFCENLNLHLGGYFLVCKIFAEHFKKQKHGNFIHFASMYGVVAPRFEIYPDSMTSPIEYSAIKAGIIHMTSYFAKYYKGNGMRFNCISPGGVSNHQDPEFKKNYSKFTINQGMLEPEDLNGLVGFLISDSSKMINGQNIVIDDGWTL